MKTKTKRPALKSRGAAYGGSVSAQTMRHVTKIDKAVGSLLREYLADQAGEPAAEAVRHFRTHCDFAFLAACMAERGHTVEVFTLVRPRS